MGICLFLYNQKLQRVEAGEILALPVLPPASPVLPPPVLPPPIVLLPPPPPASVPPAELEEEDQLEKQIAQSKKVLDLRRQLAEAKALLEEEPAPRSSWNILSRN